MCRPTTLLAVLIGALAVAAPAQADVGELTFHSCLQTAPAPTSPCTASPYVESPTDIESSPYGRGVTNGVSVANFDADMVSWFYPAPPSLLGCNQDGPGPCEIHTGSAIDGPEGLAGGGPAYDSDFVTGDANNALVRLYALTTTCAAQDKAAGCSIAHGMHHPRHVALAPLPPWDHQVYVATGDGIAWFNLTQYAFPLFAGCVNGDGSDTCAKANVGNESSIVIDRAGSTVYVGSPDGSITAMHRAADGLLTELSCITSADPAPPGCVTGNAIDSVDGLALSHDDHDLYAVSTKASSVVHFARADDGSITESDCVSSPMAGTCADGGFSLRRADSVAVSADGDNVYVGNSLTQVTTLTRDQTGALRVVGCAGPTACSPTDPLTDSPGALAIDPDGAAVYAVSRDANELTTLDRVTAVADLSLQYAAPIVDTAAGRVHATLTVTNHGPHAAPDTTVMLGGPERTLADVQLTPSSGACVPATSPLFGMVSGVPCYLGTLAPGGSATVTIVASGDSLYGVNAWVDDDPSLDEPNLTDNRLHITEQPPTAAGTSPVAPPPPAPPPLPTHVDTPAPPYTDPLAPPKPPRQRLSVSGVRAIPSTFAAARRSASQAKARVHIGTRLRFTLSAAARVTVSIAATTSGHRVGEIVRQALAGTNSISFSGRLNGRALAPGHYRATFHAEAAHLRSAAPRVVKLTVVRG